MSTKLHSDAIGVLQRLATPFTAEFIFDDFHDVVYFIKDSAGRYLVVNQTLVTRCGLKHKSQLLGKTSEEALRPPLGSSFTLQDKQIIGTGNALMGQLELHVFPYGAVGWCITNKYPLRDGSGQAIGLAGVSRDLGQPEREGQGYESLARAIDHTRLHLSSGLKVVDLVELTGLSRFQLDRRMQITFGLTTGQWLLKARIDLARDQLAGQDIPIVEIAHNAGYSDQSAFSRQFRRVTGLTPSEYRNLQRGNELSAR